jgi:chemotaxis protein methyltransferase CheR
MSLALKENYGWNHLVNDICHEVSKLTGNVMSEKQRPMVESRMRRRCLELKLSLPSDYKEYWLENLDSENKYLIGLLTTHFTSFFREFSHFEWIAANLPQIVAAARAEGRSTIKIWSAASSKGQEVWSLCMWLHHYMPKVDAKMNWTVIGSDIDQSSVKEGENGVYHARELETAPRHLWEGLWVRGKGEIADWYKIKNDLKTHAQFQTMNLLKITMPQSEKFDVVMCRNVLIYFDRQNQENIASSLLKYLTPQGVLITGMSESLTGYGLPMKSVAPSIYKLPAATATPVALPKSAAAAPAPKAMMPMPLKVLCIDDSPTVITILKKILKAPEFEIIGIANNGQEAIEKLKTLKPDVITLDLHMPIMDGPTFLKVSEVAKTLPVVVVSSVGRDHAPSIAPLFELGVTDFVEKPTLANMNEIGDELIQKLKMGWTTKKEKIVVKSSISSTSFSRPAGHIIFNVSVKDEKNLMHVLGEQRWSNDEISFYFNEALPQALKDKIVAKTTSAKKVDFVNVGGKVNASTLPTIWLIFNGGNNFVLNTYKKPHDFIILEETALSSALKEAADDVSPATSFSYLVDKLLGGK